MALLTDRTILCGQTNKEAKLLQPHMPHMPHKHTVKANGWSNFNINSNGAFNSRTTTSYIGGGQQQNCDVYCHTENEMVSISFVDCFRIYRYNAYVASEAFTLLSDTLCTCAKVATGQQINDCSLLLLRSSLYMYRFTKVNSMCWIIIRSVCRREREINIQERQSVCNQWVANMLEWFILLLASVFYNNQRWATESSEITVLLKTNQSLGFLFCHRLLLFLSSPLPPPLPPPPPPCHHCRWIIPPYSS